MDFRLLGPLEVVDQGRLLALGRGKHRALLAILLLHANEVVSTSRLIDDLWGETPPPTAAKIVRNYVSSLRKVLGAEQELLQTHAAGYCLALGRSTLDLERFEQLVELGRRSLTEGDAVRAAAVLREALALWRGAPLADFAYEVFAQREIGRLEELRLGALEERIEADLRLGRHAELVSELESLVSEHPLRERLREQLMLALYRSGRQAEALAAYQEGRRALVSELGLEPGRALQELERRILAQDSVLEAPTSIPALRLATVRARHGGVLIVLGACGLLAAVIAVAVLALGGGSVGLASIAPNSLARIDPRTNRVNAEIPVGSRPAAVVSGYGSLWVANLDDATVTRVDVRRGRIVRTISTVAAPTGVAAGAGAVWAVGADGIVRRIDPRFEAVAARVRTFKPGSLLTAGPASGAVAVGNGAVWVASGGYGATAHLSRIDPHSNSVAVRLATGEAPSDVATGLGSTWVSDSFENTVTRIDANNVVIASIPVGAVGHGPSAIAVGAGAVWVAENLDDTIVRIDPQTNSVTTTIPVGSYPTGVAVGEGSVWVANSHDGTLSRINPETNKVIQTIEIGSSPAGVAVAQGSVWVTTQAPAKIAVLAPSQGGTFRVDSERDPETDPALYPDPSISYATCAKLLNYPDKPAPHGSQLVPEVARSLPSVSADGRTYTFTIRKGFRFSPPLRDEVTAETFKYAIERSLSPRTRSLAASFVDDIVGEPAYLRGKASHISGVVAQGDRLTIRLVRRAPSFPARMATPFFCAVPPTTPIDRRGVRVIPSAGPYYVTSYVPHRQLVLKRNPNYSDSRPHRLETIVYTLGVPSSKGLAHVEAGSADYVANYLPPEQDARLAARYGPASSAAANGRQRYFVNPRLTLAFLALNTSRPLFASPRLRRAVNYAIDRRALARQGSLISGYGAFTTIPTDQYLPPGMPGSERRSIFPLGGDAAAARRIAGATNKTAVLYSCNLSLCRKHAQQIRHDLSRIGIDLDVKEFPIHVMIERAFRPGEPFDILLALWGVDYADPYDVLNVLLDPKGNLSHFRSKRWDGKLDQVAQLSGPARYRAYGKLALELARDAAPWVVYANSTWRDFFSARIGCQSFNPVYGIDLAALCLRREPQPHK
jgi:YVTN family beta-propeller protein